MDGFGEQLLGCVVADLNVSVEVVSCAWPWMRNGLHSKGRGRKVLKAVVIDMGYGAIKVGQNVLDLRMQPARERP